MARIRWSFFSEWTPELAWWLGLLFGDGMVQWEPETGNYRVSLGGPHDVCEAWAELFIEGEYRLARAGNGARSWYVYADSKRLSQYLYERWELRSPKAHNLKWPSDLPESLEAGFLRGLWDSDGTVYRDRGYPVAKYSSASEELVREVHQRVSRRMGGFTVNPLKEIRDKNESWSVKWSGKTAVPLLRLLYSEAPEGLRNERKYARALEALLWKQEKEEAKCRCGAKAAREGLCYPCWYEARGRETGPGTRCTECEIRPVVAKGLCRACYAQRRRGPSKRKRRWSVADREGLKSISLDCEPELLDPVFRLYRAQGFPWTEVTQKPSPSICMDVAEGIQQVRLKDGELQAFSPVGLPHCLYMHRHMYKAHRQEHMSVLAAFRDDALLRQALVQQGGERGGLVPERVVRYLRWRLRAPGNFSPSLAGWVARRFAASGKPVLDPCAGFGGRLLGVVAAGHRYVGIDIEGRTVRANRKLAETLETEAELIQGDCLELEWPRSGLVFTCPPYFDLEWYGRASVPRQRTYEAWLEEWFGVFVRKARQVAPRLALVLGRYQQRDENRGLVSDAVDVSVGEGWHLSERLPLARRIGASRETLLVFE